jgi:hypothetical protein
MPFQPGQSGNPNGRKKGSPNKSTKEIREAYQAFVESNVDEFQNWLAQIEDPARRFEIILKISDFFLPKMTRTEVTGADGEDLFKNITFTFTTADERNMEDNK